eukprot:scaffold74394_cov47-Prasinocladus_malaysianus.AAC.1
MLTYDMYIASGDGLGLLVSNMFSYALYLTLDPTCDQAVPVVAKEAMMQDIDGGHLDPDEEMLIEPPELKLRQMGMSGPKEFSRPTDPPRVSVSAPSAARS